MNNSTPSSLRDLYSTPSSPWSFSVPTDSVPKPAPRPSAPQSYVFPAARPAQNSIFELSPGLIEPGGVELGLLAKTLVASALLQYATTAIAMPWEVGKCLLQVQWVPRDARETEEEEPEVEELVEEEVRRPFVSVFFPRAHSWVRARS
jgi:fusion and transport protein UGO1